jgi:hypothetical protein
MKICHKHTYIFYMKLYYMLIISNMVSMSRSGVLSDKFIVMGICMNSNYSHNWIINGKCVNYRLLLASHYRLKERRRREFLPKLPIVLNRHTLFVCHWSFIIIKYC